MKRVVALDSLRGILALIVTFHHCVLVLPGVREAIEASYVLRPLIAGPQVVSAFFVLSGFALYGLLDGPDAPAYRDYLAKRLVRLWPPLAVAIVMAALLCLAIRPGRVDGVTDWFTERSWRINPSFGDVIGNLALFGDLRYRQLDNVTWSLAHEMKFSLLLPVILPLIRRRPITSLALATCLSIAARHLPQSVLLAQTVDPVTSMRYLFLFVAGAALAVKRVEIGAFARSARGHALVPTGTVIALALLGSPDPTLSFPGALGALLLVTICATSPVAAAWLDRPVLAWLGRVSYSLYLVHLPVLLTLVYTMHDLLPLWLLVVLAPVVSFGVAEIMYRLVERHAIALARRIGSGTTKDLAASQMPFAAHGAS